MAGCVVVVWMAVQMAVQMVDERLWWMVDGWLWWMAVRMLAVDGCSG